MNCPYCQKPEYDDGSIIHHGNCTGLEIADLNNLQLDRLTEALQKISAKGREHPDPYVEVPWFAGVAEDALRYCGLSKGGENG